MRINYLIPFIVLLFSCKNELPIQEDLRVDLIPVIDSTFLNELTISKNTKLKSSTVLAYVEKLIPYTFDGYIYQSIPEYLLIDSLKKVNAYSSYLNSLDIGMIQDAQAYQIQHLEFNDNWKAKIWQIYYSSYEACPFYTGNDVFLSIFRNEELTSTVQIGSDYSVVDPPVAFNSFIYSHFENENLHITLSQEEIEMAESLDLEDKIINSNHQSFIFNIRNESFQD